MSTLSRPSRCRLPSSDRRIRALRSPDAAGGSRTFVPTIAPQVLKDATEITLRCTVSVLDRGVEIVHFGFQGTGDCPLLISGIAADHQPADRSTPEAQDRNLQPCPAKRPFFHRVIPHAGGTAIPGRDNYRASSSGDTASLWSAAPTAACAT